MSPQQKPANRTRQSLFKAFRARRRRLSNLWLSYSTKINRDVVLSSDREFIHWLVYLECNPDVVVFDVSDEVLSSDEAPEGAVAAVNYKDGSFRWHVSAINEEVSLSNEKTIPITVEMLQRRSLFWSTKPDTLIG